MLWSIFWFLILAVSVANAKETKDEKNVWKSFGNYTSIERRAIDKLRNAVEPELYQGYMKTDQYLIRWLRDQNLDLDKARGKLLRHIQWRKENRIDVALHEDFTRILRQCPHDTSGRDKLGRPVVTIAAGSCAVRKLALSGDIDNLRRALYHIVETAIADLYAAQAQGKEVIKFIMIISASGFSLREHGCINCFPLVAEALTLYEDHYPEYFQRIFLINIPRIMESMLVFAQSFLSDRTKAVLRFYGYNREEWAPELLKFISADQLDPQFGGTRKSGHDRRSPPEGSQNEASRIKIQGDR